MNIGIVGLGLMGGTIAKSLNKNHNISAYDISKETINYALANKIINKAYNDVSDLLNNNEVIYICLYPNNIINFIFKYKDLFPINSVIIEISGIKAHLINEIRKIKTKNVDIIYSHPIAGSEKNGVTNSNKKIFKNANYVITPVKENKEKNIELAKRLAEEMGFLNISLISPKEHDNIIAYTSQLTHVLSLSLVNSLSSQLDVKMFIGDSYRDLTRISMINEKLWSELFLTNKDQLLSKINLFIKELDKFKEAIIMNNKNFLIDLMIKSKNIRTLIEGVNTNEN